MAYIDAEFGDFQAYMVAVNTEIEARTGLGFMDIEDWGYRDAYADGVDPKDAAVRALENAGWEA